MSATGGGDVPLTRGLMALMVIAVFATGGAIHFQTPMLGQMAAELQASPAQIGWVATLSFAGFLAGTVFLAPLGDCFDKRLLILAQMSSLVVSLLAMAVAPTLTLLALAAFVVGIGTSVSQHMIALASELAAPEARGRTVGTVLSGVFVGILYARLVGGMVAASMSWRWMYAGAALLVLLMTAAVFARLPGAPPSSRQPLAGLYGSLLRLWREQARVRRASAIQFLMGIGYGGFWATLASMMWLLHGLGPAAAGLMAIPGAAGILVARPAGRWMDRSGAGPVVKAGIVGIIAAFVALAFAPQWIGAAVIGAILLDCGLRAALVANQTMVIDISPQTRGRASTVLMAHVWGGNAVGALLASAALTHAGWLAVCGICLGAALLALVLGWREFPRLAAGA